MRTIDADAFAEFLKDVVKRQKYEDTKINGLLTVADVIEAVISELDGTSLDGFKNAPTIEPERKKGKWVDASVSGMPAIHHEECGAFVYAPNGSRHFNFCPFCGAEMRGEGE